MTGGLLPLDAAGRYIAARREAGPLRRPRSSWQSFGRRHSAFLIVLALAALLRVIVMVAYFPAFWYSDSFGYVGGATVGRQVLAPALHPYPYAVRPTGYSLLLLWPLRGLHSVAAVAIVQAAFGLLAGTLIYLLLRRRFRFAGWTATLAASPVLLSAYELQLEHFMLSDTLFMVLTVAAMVLALWRQVPAMRSCVLVGLLLGAAAITRTEGLPLAASFAAALLTSYVRVPGRLIRIVALVIGFALPTLAYATWFKDVHGHFELESTYGGAFLASRVEPFANCSVMHPPANEKWLCLSTPGSRRLTPDDYLWGAASVTPLAKPPTGPPFSARTSAIAEKFAIHAIQHQPAAYGASVWRTFLQTFSGGGGPYSNGQQSFMFPAHQPETVDQLAQANPGDTARPFYQYNGGRNPDTGFRQPWAAMLRAYQVVAVVPPPLLAGIVTFGLAGICLAFRRRGGPALLPWLTGIVMLVTPAAGSSYEARYVVPTVPLLCIAAALAIREVGNRNRSVWSARRDVPPAADWRSYAREGTRPGTLPHRLQHPDVLGAQVTGM
jgi:hypothetical protein